MKTKEEAKKSRGREAEKPTTEASSRLRALDVPQVATFSLSTPWLLECSNSKPPEQSENVYENKR